MTASQRREMVLQAALTEFAVPGLDGTSAQDIAQRAGISHPCLFRLFPTKKALFLSVVRRCFQQVTQRLPLRPSASRARTRCRPWGPPSGSCASSGRCH
jgi:AcrR family transcriptional regulator